MSSPFRRLERVNLWWQLRAALWTSPIWHFIYERILRVASPRVHARLVDRSTDIVIEAFPRSANTFLVHAFWASSVKQVKIAHHLHDLIQVERGLKFGVPVVIMVRNPLDAFASYWLREPRLSPSTMRRMYEGFYKRVLKLSDRVVLLNYEDIVARPDEVLERIHDLLRVPEQDRRAVSIGQVFESIDQAERNLRKAEGKTKKLAEDKGGSFTKSVARPTADKEAQKKAVIEELQRNHSDALSSTNNLYLRLLDHCVNFDEKEE